MKCRVCSKDTEPFMRISSDGLEEPFLDDTLRKQLPELKLCRCRQCGCLWADDARQDEATLVAAYERVSDSYFDSPENDDRTGSAASLPGGGVTCACCGRAGAA